LNIVVPDDLDAITPGIPEIKEMAIYWSYAGSVEGRRASPCRRDGIKVPMMVATSVSSSMI
jgi:hypothetical protein